VLVRFGKAENKLMDYLVKNGTISLSMFRKIAGIPSYRAESILANLILFKVLRMNASEKGFTYELNAEEQQDTRDCLKSQNPLNAETAERLRKEPGNKI
jgi:hypothetical protein